MSNYDDIMLEDFDLDLELESFDNDTDYAYEDFDWMMFEADDAEDDDMIEDDAKSDEVQEATFAAAMLLDSASREEISQIAESMDDMNVMVECFGPVMEKVIVRLDRKARLTHLQKAAIFKLAAQAKDPKYRKLVTLWKMERQIESYLAKKYGSKAGKVAREQIKNYTATGIKKVKGNPNKEVGKGRVGNKVAARAINQTKASFSKK